MKACHFGQFRIEQVLAWTVNDEDRCIIRHLSLGEQVERFHFVVLGFDRTFGFGVSIPGGIIDRVLAMPFEENTPPFSLHASLSGKHW